MYFLNIVLSRLMFTEFHEREVNGELVKCISIPLDINGIMIRRKNEPHLYCLMKERQPNPNGELFSIIPYISSKRTFAKLCQSGWWRNMYFLGKVTKYRGKSLENKLYKNKNVVSLDDAMERE